MFETLHCVAFRTIKYNDERSIVSAWSVERGYVSFAMPAGKGREATRRRALTMPLSAFEGVCDIRPGRDVMFIRDIRPINFGPSSGFDASKLAVALFLAEFFEKILRMSQRDDALSAMVFDTVKTLQDVDKRSTANFTLWTLYRLTAPLGIQPDSSDYRPGAIFDIENAVWRQMGIVRHIAEGIKEGQALHLLSRMTSANISRIRLSRDERREILDGLLRYYDLHYCKVTPLRSLDIVRELF